MTTSVLVVAETRATAQEWAEHNVRFTIGFDEVTKASVDEAIAYLDSVAAFEESTAGDVEGGHRFDGVVLVRDPAQHLPTRLLGGLRRIVALSSVVVASWPPPTNKVRTCRLCGCHDLHACVTAGVPCRWVEQDLCSACARSTTTSGVGT